MADEWIKPQKGLIQSFVQPADDAVNYENHQSIESIVSIFKIILDEAVAEIKKSIDDSRMMNNRHTSVICDKIVGEFKNAVPQRKRPPPGLIQRIMIASLAQGGLCPCCRSVPVIDQALNRLNNSQIDHCEMVGKATFATMWLVCGDCHYKLTHEEVFRVERRSMFDSYQKIAKSHSSKEKIAEISARQRSAAEKKRLEGIIHLRDFK